jgi:hypothetical protein
MNALSTVFALDKIEIGHNAGVAEGECCGGMVPATPALVVLTHDSLN